MPSLEYPAAGRPEQVPVVQKALHEASDGGHKGNAGLPPCFLLNLLQQAARASEGNKHNMQFMSFAGTRVRARGQGPGRSGDSTHHTTALPGVGPKQLGSTPRSTKQGQGNY